MRLALATMSVQTPPPARLYRVQAAIPSLEEAGLEAVEELRGEVEAQAVGALRAVRQDRSSNPERAMNYLNRARQCPTAFRAV